MASSETSCAYLFDHCVAILQESLSRRVHRHAAHQLTVSLDGREHRVGASEETLASGLVHLVGSGVPHVFRGDGRQLNLWLPPDSRVARRLARTYLPATGIAALPPELLDGLPLERLSRYGRGCPSGAEVGALTERVLSSFGAAARRPTEAMHPAVRHALRIIRELDTKAISATELAARVGLSTSRFLHVFTENMGTPLRPYLQWLRCLDVLTLITSGRSVTDAAVEAGFTDGAHCNRVVKRFFCLSPSAFAASDRMRVELCLTQIAG